MTEKELLDYYHQDLSDMVYRDGKARPKSRKADVFLRIGKALENREDRKLYSENQKWWIWSDQHFFHKNIIAYSERPYADVLHMNYSLMMNHNKLVGKNDVVIWAGDVGFAADWKINRELRQYNGYKILVVGNHDLDHSRMRLLEFDEIHVAYELDLPESKCVITHYPLTKVPDGMINIHGHEHADPGKVHNEISNQHINVCLELHQYAPISLTEIRSKIRNTKPAIE